MRFMAKKRTVVALFFLLLSLSLPLASPASARDIDPIVGTAWLAEHLGDPGLVILDIRKVEEYRAGHIPGAVSGYYGVWVHAAEGMRTEYPAPDELFDAIGALGIGQNSRVVIVCRTHHCFYQVMAPRVLCTLMYAGLENIAILDGGHDAWAREQRPVSVAPVTPKRTVYRGRLNTTMRAAKNYLAGRLGKASVVDVREAALFSGGKKQPFVKRAGHIPGAVNLPASAAYTERGTFKTREELRALATQALGEDRAREVITYCDSGRCCPTWAFLLSQVLGYEHVKLYDGSLEEWTRDPELPLAQ
jgi:thiosulfate/3-mercaptopyruvate sulfurtransferase